MLHIMPALQSHDHSRIFMYILGYLDRLPIYSPLLATRLQVIAFGCSAF